MAFFIVLLNFHFFFFFFRPACSCKCCNYQSNRVTIIVKGIYVLPIIISNKKIYFFYETKYTELPERPSRLTTVAIRKRIISKLKNYWKKDTLSRFVWKSYQVFITLGCSKQSALFVLSIKSTEKLLLLFDFHSSLTLRKRRASHYNFHRWLVNSINTLELLKKKTRTFLFSIYSMNDDSALIEISL